ncbi:Rv3235 family protein [Streptomyces sp. NPDC093225]|uniref:Rv3235 family protein n=1 Tax=Streptomyces sp. NPDC093225 TaxID=3366034 RepID=UPI003814C089
MATDGTRPAGRGRQTGADPTRPGGRGSRAGTDPTRPGGRHDQRRPRDPRVPRQGTPPAPVAVGGPARSAVLPSTGAAVRGVRPHDWFAERLLAVLSGQRPVHWMLGHTVAPAYDQLIDLAPGAPLRPASRVRPRVSRCDWRAPVPGVLEAFARIAAGDRVTAMAFRLERGPDHRWRCAAVEIGPRP